MKKETIDDFITSTMCAIAEIDERIERRKMGEYDDDKGLYLDRQITQLSDAIGFLAGAIEEMTRDQDY